MVTFPNPLSLDPVTAWAIPVFVVSLGLEAWALTRERQRAYPVADAVSSVAMGALSGPLNAGVKVLAFVAFTWLYQFRLFDLDMGLWWTWPLIVLGDDLSYYLHHRMGHTVRVLWAGHVSHHSSENYNFAVALRQGLGELATKYLWYAWLPLVGFPPLAVMVMAAVSLIFQFFLHTEVVGRLGPLEWLFNTPSHHRVHHGSNVRYLDRNHGGILILWDKLFGTFEPEDPKEPVHYGLTSNLQSNNLWTIATHEYAAIWRDMKRSPRLMDKLGYVFRPPGWSHDGSTLTANQLRAREASEVAGAPGA